MSSPAQSSVCLPARGRAGSPRRRAMSVRTRAFCSSTTPGVGCAACTPSVFCAVEPRQRHCTTRPGCSGLDVGLYARPAPESDPAMVSMHGRRLPSSRACLLPAPPLALSAPRPPEPVAGPSVLPGRGSARDPSPGCGSARRHALLRGLARGGLWVGTPGGVERGTGRSARRPRRKARARGRARAAARRGQRGAPSLAQAVAK